MYELYRSVGGNHRNVPDRMACLRNPPDGFYKDNTTQYPGLMKVLPVDIIAGGVIGLVRGSDLAFMVPCPYLLFLENSLSLL